MEGNSEGSGSTIDPIKAENLDRRTALSGIKAAISARLGIGSTPVSHPSVPNSEIISSGDSTIDPDKARRLEERLASDARTSIQNHSSRPLGEE